MKTLSQQFECPAPGALKIAFTNMNATPTGWGTGIQWTVIPTASIMRASPLGTATRLECSYSYQNLPVYLLIKDLGEQDCQVSGSQATCRPK